MRFFIINTKNFVEATGRKLDSLASYVSSLRSQKKIRVLIAVPAFDLRYLHAKFPHAELLAQHVDPAKVGFSTGFLVPELAKIAGARGSLINHSEHRIDHSSIEDIVKRLRDLKMLSIVCAQDHQEVGQIASLNPNFVAVEPPELIGSGNAVSKASPEIIMRSRSALEAHRISGSETNLLCGAGIVSGDDAQKAIELGADGILVASGVILSRDWRAKIAELSRGLSDAS